MSRQSLEREIIAYEVGLLDPLVRQSVEQLDDLLHADFREFGSSGTVWDRERTIITLLNEHAKQKCITRLPSDFDLRWLSTDTALLTYKVVKNSPSEQIETLRTSIWVRVDNRWKLLFHQGTLVENK